MNDIQPPADILIAIKPAVDLPVQEFLVLHVLRRPGSRKYNQEPLRWFSKNPPNTVPPSLGSLLLPSAPTCIALDSLLSAAVIEGYKSVQHPTREGEYLPLWCVCAWKWGSAMLEKHKFWMAARDWIKRYEEEEEWSQHFTSKAIDALNRSPWMSGLPHLQRGAVTSTTVAGGLLSKAWLNDEIIDCILDVIRGEMLQHGVSECTQVAGTALTTRVAYPESNTACFWGEKLRSGEVLRLLLPCNLQNVHWIALEVDVQKRCINIGDSMPSPSNRDALNQTLKHLQGWLKTYLPAIDDWIINPTALSAQLQLDGSSCGIAVVNAIHRRVLASTPAWTPKAPCRSRAWYYIRCIEFSTTVSNIC